MNYSSSSKYDLPQVVGQRLAFLCAARVLPQPRPRVFALGELCMNRTALRKSNGGAMARGAQFVLLHLTGYIHVF